MIIIDGRSIQERITMYVAEFLATFILMYVGCMACVSPSTTALRHLLEVAFGFGCAVATAIECFGAISGSHINPIITLAAFLLGKLPLVEIPGYLTGQFLGSTAAYGLIRIMMAESLIFGKFYPDAGICAKGLNPQLTTAQGLAIETGISFILILITCSIVDSRNIMSMGTAGLKFAVTIFILAIVAGPFTSCHMNPARTFGPVVVNNAWKKNSWIYWAGPFGGSALATICYIIFFCDNM
ncbi:hypothetical protein Zmor_014127 [Zophobas morio]|uniref:Aquaporin n=1 Tax=Zophobas morio TaxID=2755281 RepID=A0AA38IE98_9CUCU|nr:hypothetical protein Zmor_014127 [Zophobas morio]